MKYFLLALMLLAPVVTSNASTPKTAATSIAAVRFGDVELKTGVRLRYAEQGNKVYEATGHCPNWEEPKRFVKDLEFLAD